MRPLPFPRTSQAHHRGAALVLVLSVLVIVSGLVLAMFTLSKNEVVATQNDLSATRARLLAEAAVNAVQGQIQSATTRGSGISWASQPGMIRNYDDNGAAAGFVKLYSWANMNGPGAFTPLAAPEQVPAGWASQPDFYVDLNRPAKVGSRSVYPIADPAALDTNPAIGTASAGAVDEFRLTSTAVVDSATGANPLPMPVQWLYVLQDGRITSATAAASGVTVADASPQNPIVGRIAFWADDETAKVNLNTASEGTFWDVPLCMSAQERNFADSVPPIGEYQRYPGHPATTSLSAVLGSWMPAPSTITGASDYANLAKYFSLVPRTQTGGSQAGLVINNRLNVTAPNPLAKKSSRLFSTVDEALYAIRADSAAPNVTGNRTRGIDLTPEVIERSRFFLTTSSRAPDLNLFNLPRVSIWPLHSETSSGYRTPEDRLIAFASSIGKSSGGAPYAYHFTRNDPDSTTKDFRLPRNQALFRYLQNLASRKVPGYGASLQTKWGGTTERDQMLAEIFDYIRVANLCDPKLASGNPAPQQFSNSLPAPKTYTYGYDARYTDAGRTSLLKASTGQVVPTVDSAPGTGNPIKGLGRFSLVDQLLLVCYTDEAPTPAGNATATTQTKVRMYIVPSLVNPHLGFMRIRDSFDIEVTATGAGTNKPLEAFIPAGSSASINGTLSDFDLFPGGNGRVSANKESRMARNGRNWGGSMDGSVYLDKYLRNDGDKDSFGLFGGNAVTLQGNPDQPGTFRWGMREATFSVRVSKNGQLIQTSTFKFPEMSDVPIPKGLVSPTAPAYLKFDTGSAAKWRSRGGDGYIVLAAPDASWAMQTGDFARSIVNKTGDFRLIASKRVIPENWNSPLDTYSSKEPDGSLIRMSYNMRDGAGFQWQNLSSGKVIAGLVEGEQGKQPFVRKEINGVGISTVNENTTFHSNAGPQGDWNNGFGTMAGGAWLNKPDEGAIGPTDVSQMAWFDYDGGDQASNLTSPNKQMPSAVMFGSLPVGTTANVAWRTLLFRPDFTNHPGLGNSATVPDSVLLDLFTMPIVEPYAISEPFSTAGRVNMNYQIVPFTYIQRDSGLRAVLKNERVAAVTDSDTNYKKYDNVGTYRFPVNLQETLKPFESKFTAGEIFRSPSEICGISIVPQKSGATQAGMAAFWISHRFTGDNTRERPYATIYPRLTTQSNTYTVHYIVQVLKKPPSRELGAAVTSFDPSKGDKILRELRGSATIERYVDPNNPSLPDFATDAVGDAALTVAPYYRFRTVSSTVFAP